MHLDNFAQARAQCQVIFLVHFLKKKCRHPVFDVSIATWCGMTLLRVHMQVRIPTGWGLAKE